MVEIPRRARLPGALLSTPASPGGPDPEPPRDLEASRRAPASIPKLKLTRPLPPGPPRRPKIRLKPRTAWGLASRSPSTGPSWCRSSGAGPPNDAPPRMAGWRTRPPRALAEND